MKLLNSIGLAAAIGLTSLSATASTLVYDFSGTLSVTFDPAYHSQEVIDQYSAEFTEAARYKTFSGQLVLPSFENYLTGSHDININTNGLQLSLISGLFGGLEGTKVNVLKPGPKPIIGTTYVPDSTQAGDSGTLSIVNGKVAGFSWFAGAASSIVTSYNSHVAEYFGWPTRLGEISVSLVGSTPSLHIGDVYLASNQSGAASVSMVPESGSAAMLLSGLGIIGAIVRRRRISRSTLA